MFPAICYIFTLRPTFPSTCLSPDQPGYGQVVSPGSGRRKNRRTYAPPAAAEPQQDWTIISPTTAQPHAANHLSNVSGPSSVYQPRRLLTHAQEYSLPQSNESSVQLHMPYPTQQPTMTSVPPTSYGPGPSRASQPSPSPTARPRYSPYQSPLHISASAVVSPSSRASATFDDGHNIRLAPIREVGDSRSERRNSTVSLPPISTLDGFRQGPCDDSATVLRRLQIPDEQSRRPEVSSYPHTAHHIGHSPTYHQQQHYP